MFKSGDKIGSGSYGRVYAATLTGEPEAQVYAIKRNIISERIDFMGSVKELDILNKLFRTESGYLSLCTHYLFNRPFAEEPSPVSRELKDDTVYFVFKRLPMNLHEFFHKRYVLKSIKHLMLNILLGLQILHHNKIAHLDIKPSNILIYNSGTTENPVYTAMLADFGMSRFLTRQVYQTGIAITSWYRGPEMCSPEARHDISADIWSLGCVFYEMAFRTTLLNVKEREDDHEAILRQIVLHYPGLSRLDLKAVVKDKCDDWLKIRNKSTGDWYSRLDKKLAEDFEAQVGRYDLFTDLLSKMLCFNPSKRITVTEALQHPFFSEYRECIIYHQVSCLIDVASIKYPIAPVLDRQYIRALTQTVYNNRDQLKWYTHQILVHTLELYDRYLSHMYELKKDTLNIATPIIDSDDGDRLVKFNVCLYLAIKYFHHDIKMGFFQVLVHSNPTLIHTQALAFEKFLIHEVLKYNIFVWTVFEYPDRLNFEWKEDQVKLLITQYPEIVQKTFDPQLNAGKLLETYIANLG